MKRLLILIALISVFAVKVQAQNRKLITQYIQQLNGAPDDKSRVDIMNKIAEEFLTTTEEVAEDFWDQPMKYAKDAAALAEKIG